MPQIRIGICGLMVWSVMAACGGEPTPEERSASQPSNSDANLGEVEATAMSSGQSGSAPDPCSVLTIVELETAAGFALGPGTFNDLTNQGIEGATCAFTSENDREGNVSVTVVSGEVASALFDDERMSHPIDISGVGDRAIANVNDIQASILFQQGRLILGVSVVYLTGTRDDPSTIQERLEVLATIASSRI